MLTLGTPIIKVKSKLSEVYHTELIKRQVSTHLLREKFLPEERKNKEVDLIMSQIDRMLIAENQSSERFRKDEKSQKDENFNDMKLFYESGEDLKDFEYVAQKSGIEAKLREHELIGFEEEDVLMITDTPTFQEMRAKPAEHMKSAKHKDPGHFDNSDPAHDPESEKDHVWAQIQHNLKQKDRDQMKIIDVKQNLAEQTQIDREFELSKASWMRLDNQVVNAHVFKNKLGVMLDVGTNLSHSGQKPNIGWGSMSEHVAAGILKHLGIIERAKADGEIKIFDPFMGSGTFLLESLFNVIDYPKELSKVNFMCEHLYLKKGKQRG